MRPSHQTSGSSSSPSLGREGRLFSERTILPVLTAMLFPFSGLLALVMRTRATPPARDDAERALGVECAWPLPE
jgi:hypothetical protein